MIIVRHRVNTLRDLRATPSHIGVEVDIRPYGKGLVLHHDPFRKGEPLGPFLDACNHALVILNVKGEGIERRVIEMAEERGIRNYFLLDVTFPFIIKCVEQGATKLALRFSEYESIDTCLALKGKVEWVFVDNFTHLPVDQRAFERLGNYFKLCVVSPELLHRDEIPQTKELLRRHPVDAVLTDDVRAWQV